MAALVIYRSDQSPFSLAVLDHELALEATLGLIILAMQYRVATG